MAQIGCTPSKNSGYNKGCGGIDNKHVMGSYAGRRGYYGGSPGYDYGGPSSSSSMGKASELLPYLSSACAQLSEAIRTGSARGVHQETLSQLREEYREKCALEDAEARRRVGEDKSANIESQRREREGVKQEKAVSQREKAQCDELLRILAGKRKRRAEMIPGELSDLARSEAAYQGRCKV